jgi:hypothetical protein
MPSGSDDSRGPPAEPPRSTPAQHARTVEGSLLPVGTGRVTTDPRAWAAFTVFATVVSTLHFAGLHYRIYWDVWWWDLLTHYLSGLGVAALFPLLGVVDERPRLASGLFVVGGVVAIGAGFEVYERLFRTFWHEWTLAYYLEDTAVDIVVDAVGAATLAVGLWMRRD